MGSILDVQDLCEQVELLLGSSRGARADVDDSLLRLAHLLCDLGVGQAFLVLGGAESGTPGVGGHSVCGWYASKLVRR